MFSLILNIRISIPVGYGLGSSGAVALSLSYALDQVLETKLDKLKLVKLHILLKLIVKQD